MVNSKIQEPVEKQDCVGLELCVAAFQGDITYLKALLEGGCPVGAADYDLRTAAHISCAENNQEIVKVLHQFGADFHTDKVKDRFGVTPLMEAESHGHKELVVFIHQLIADSKYILRGILLCVFVPLLYTHCIISVYARQC